MTVLPPNFQSFVYSLSYKVVAVTETWLSDHIYDREILSNGFMIFHNIRNTRGAGSP